MDNLIGYPLKEALKRIEASDYKIVNIRKILGTNNKFNGLVNPYVIREQVIDDCITLFVSYY